MNSQITDFKFTFMNCIIVSAGTDTAEKFPIRMEIQPGFLSNRKTKLSSECSVVGMLAQALPQLHS